METWFGIAEINRSLISPKPGPEGAKNRVEQDKLRTKTFLVVSPQSLCKSCIGMGLGDGIKRIHFHVSNIQI